MQIRHYFYILFMFLLSSCRYFFEPVNLGRVQLGNKEVVQGEVKIQQGGKYYWGLKAENISLSTRENLDFLGGTRINNKPLVKYPYVIKVSISNKKTGKLVFEHLYVKNGHYYKLRGQKIGMGGMNFERGTYTIVFQDFSEKIPEFEKVKTSFFFSADNEKI